MNKKYFLILLIFVLMIQLMALPALAFNEERSMDNNSSIELSALALPDLSIGDSLLETMRELIETIRIYMETVQDSVLELVENIGTPEEEPAPVEEPEPDPVVDESEESIGSVQGRLMDDNRQPLADMLILLGDREVRTDANGNFTFSEVPYGNYSLVLIDSDTEDEVFLTSFTLDDENKNYSVNLLVSLPDPEQDVPDEIVVMTEEDEEDSSGFLLPGILLALLAAAIGVLVYLRNRKHIKVVDGKTAMEISTKTVRILPTTRIDLTEEFEHASGGEIRVQFLKPVRNKLDGCRVLFLNQGLTVGEVKEYRGQLEVFVQLPAEPLEDSSDLPREQNPSQSEHIQHKEE